MIDNVEVIDDGKFCNIKITDWDHLKEYRYGFNNDRDEKCYEISYLNENGKYFNGIKYEDRRINEGFQIRDENSDKYYSNKCVVMN